MADVFALPRKLLLRDETDFKSPPTHRTLLRNWTDNDPKSNWISVAVIVFLVIGSGCMSGLTLGLLSLDPVDIEVLKRSGTPVQKRNAMKIHPVIKDTHFLLVTLLLCNAACMEALPIFLDKLIDPLSSILISVTAILVFGEIIPQAVCAQHGLAIGAFLAWPVRALMLLCSPISWPAAKLLDCLLPKDTYTLFRRTELKAFVGMHGVGEGWGGILSDDEVQVISGALDLTNKVAYIGMTPLDKVVMLAYDEKLNRSTLRTVLASGNSRIPIYKGTNRMDIVGFILTKDLLHYSIEDEVPISSIRMRPIPRLSAATPMYSLLKLFQTGRSHMAVLTQPAPEEGDLALLSPKSVGDPEPWESGGSEGTSELEACDGCGVLAALGRTLRPPGQEMEEHVHIAVGPTPICDADEDGVARDGKKVGPTTAQPGEAIGIITIEDVIEELMGREILDETDGFADNERTITVTEAFRKQLVQVDGKLSFFEVARASGLFSRQTTSNLSQS